MLTSLAFIFLIGMSMAAICKKLKLPGIIGMLSTGMALGPYALNLLDPAILGISAELRRMALIIILIKAGLTLDLEDLKKVGRPALLMSFLPACFEILGFVTLGPLLLGLNLREAAVMGSVLAAVSPAVVVPRMVALIEEKRGTKKGIPQLILAGASLDDVFVIVLFSTFCGMAKGDSVSLLDLGKVPVSIVSGICIGAALGWLMAVFFEYLHSIKRTISNSRKTILLLAAAFLLMAAEGALEGILPMSGLLGVMSMALFLQRKCDPSVGKDLAAKYGRLWIAAEVILFVLVGAAVDIRFTLEAGPAAALMIFAALVFRAAGVWLCMLGTSLTARERIFCVISYLPKATVQAAIGSVPLAMGLPCGRLVLSVAVLAIILTAPLGAIGIDSTASILLEDDR